MGIFNRKARFIERRKFQLPYAGPDRRKQPHGYTATAGASLQQQRVNTHNTYVDNSTVVVDNSPDLLTTMVEAEIIADAFQPSMPEGCQPDTSSDVSSSSDSSSSDFGGFDGGDSGGGGASSDW